MSQRAVERFIGRLITDDQFRQRAHSSLSETCYEAGLELTPDEINLLSRMEFGRFTELSRSIDPGLRRTGYILGK